MYILCMYVCMYVCISVGLDLSSSLELQAVMFAQKQQHMEALLTYESIAQTQQAQATSSSYIHTSDRIMSRDGIMKSLHGYTYIHSVHYIQVFIHAYIHTYRLGAYLTLSGFGNTAESKHNNSIATHTYSSEISWRLGENAANSLSQWSYPTTTLPQQPTTYMGYNSTSINSSTVSSTSSQYHSVNRYISASLTAMLTVKNSETAVLISSKCRSSLFDNILNGIFPHTYKHIYSTYIHTHLQISQTYMYHTQI